MKGELMLVNTLEYSENIWETTMAYNDFGISLYIDEKNPLEVQLTKILQKSIKKID